MFNRGLRMDLENVSRSWRPLMPVAEGLGSGPALDTRRWTSGELTRRAVCP
jgi:hypothetical protein